ncbi:unnamed protein product [Cylicostephanus goldi]|uniref:Uncharacterized protein n=1 Tax=Cylicostephanus goldi TaxID=71465 RepID=A0A3P6UEH5_CYLGO|nr:unnamed protein product [Cylicostephanus goldi]
MPSAIGIAGFPRWIVIAGDFDMPDMQMVSGESADPNVCCRAAAVRCMADDTYRCSLAAIVQSLHDFSRMFHEFFCLSGPFPPLSFHRSSASALNSSRDGFPLIDRTFFSLVWWQTRAVAPPTLASRWWKRSSWCS